MLFCVVSVVVCCGFFFFKQKTAYEMRISDWSSDVCSSDLLTVSNALRSAIAERGAATLVLSGGRSPIAFFERLAQQELDWAKVTVSLADEQIGRASCRERVCQYG